MKLVMATEMGLRQKGAGDSEERERQCPPEESRNQAPFVPRCFQSAARADMELWLQGQEGCRGLSGERMLLPEAVK